MLEYFSHKKVKKHQAEKQAEKQATREAVLSPGDEAFLQRIVSEDAPPALPDRPVNNMSEVGDPTGNTSQVAVVEKGTEPQVAVEDKKGKDKDQKKSNRFSFLQRVGTKKSKKHTEDGLDPNLNVDPAEAGKEEDDITKVLESLNLSAENNRVFSLSPASQKLVQQFTVVLKDLVNGVPTAYDDLVHLLDSSQGQLQKSFSSLPPFLQKLVRSLPTKLTGSLAPEVLAAATEAQGVNTAGAAGGGLAGMAAKAAMKVPNLKDLVTKPGAVIGLLKAIMNTLKLRWPAFLGTNVLWSLAIFVLLFVFWYCHKRGKEVRLEKEQAASDVLNSEGRVEELADDPMIGGSASDPAVPVSSVVPETKH